NIRSPPMKVCRRLKTTAPITIAKKKSFRSAPMRVRGALSERYTGLSLRFITREIVRVQGIGSSSWEEPRHEVHSSYGHADTKHNAGQRALGRAFAESEHQSAHYDRD